ncbi:hypothetical protein QJS04_geneDACA000570 [Acorus gramineus]|uniref:Thioredoxin domain-containing protein n=1 Tax=Acorus gramineus TaxID=55184 RepID=A0AAV9API4_ACOGR|nr:hypothetical protein QJS04_geneDACA000570 [Acorus gramineus]
MAGLLKSRFCVLGSTEVESKERKTTATRVSGSSSSSVSFRTERSSEGTVDLSETGLKGTKLVLEEQQSSSNGWNPKTSSVHVKSSICIARSMRWWEKISKPNMVEVNSAQELVDSLSNAGDRLVIVDFYSPGCGGCKALHPKVCQFAESNPNALFLKVNYEEQKAMCQSLNIHVLPFFRFYRGAQGRVCSFSCTNATIKKFKDALAKHGTEQSGLGPAKGLEEQELLNLASNREVRFSYSAKMDSLFGADEDNLVFAQ